MKNPVFTHLNSLFAFVLIIWFRLSGFFSIWINLYLVAKTLKCALESEVTDLEPSSEWWGPKMGEVDLVYSSQNWQLILSLKEVAALRPELVVTLQSCICMYMCLYSMRQDQQIWPGFGHPCKFLFKEIKYYWTFLKTRDVSVTLHAWAL